MKKFYLLLAAAMLIAMPSCKKDPANNGKKEEAEKVSRIFEDFENGGILRWTPVEGAAFKLVANPKKAGINTSETVGQYTTATHEWDYIWSSRFGDEIDPETNQPKWKKDQYVPIDFNEGWIIKIDCLAPAAGIPVYCKLEIDGGNGKEIKDVKTTKANEWEVLEFDYEPLALESGKYCDFVICVDAGGKTAGTVVYLDNFRQVKGE
ncbi:MAG: hypothetical protein IJM35_04675 [Bacteroidales bacterium]|nr:hypothetical protein [Bacteroidales bacterium]